MDTHKKTKSYAAHSYPIHTTTIETIEPGLGKSESIVSFNFFFLSPFGFGSRGAPDTPLRMLVPASVVGAIIGKGGQTVRQITQLKVRL